VTDAPTEAAREAFMRLALDEAAKAIGRTHPNPPVGALVVKDGVVVGRGHHRRAGLPHAEVEALADACEAKGVTGFTPLPVGSTRAYAASEVGASQELLGGGGRR
jgi:diaminohydroxyphosphoribosylaminopyrimidine deaminase/5-amino-6-(5-phosphoribosylamino)uracil reductase